jgi:hypothetical protein
LHFDKFVGEDGRGGVSTVTGVITHFGVIGWDLDDGTHGEALEFVGVFSLITPKSFIKKIWGRISAIS